MKIRNAGKLRPVARPSVGPPAIRQLNSPRDLSSYMQVRLNMGRPASRIELPPARQAAGF